MKNCISYSFESTIYEGISILIEVGENSVLVFQATMDTLPGAELHDR